VFFHPGAPAVGESALCTDDDLHAAAACHLSPARQLQVATALVTLRSQVTADAVAP